MKNYRQEEHKISIEITLKRLLMLSIALVATAHLQAQNITYSFENAQVTNDGSFDYYEADIVLTTDSDFALGLGQFYLDYNTAAFGTNIFGTNLTFTHPVGSATEYILDERIFGGFANGYQVTLANSTTSKLSIAWVVPNAGNIPVNIIAGTSNLICHIKIKYEDINEDPTLSFDSVLGQDLTFIDGNPSGTQITTDTFDSSESDPANSWRGTTDTDWDTATNWSLGTVPTGTTKVLIDNVANDPVASGNITVNELTINVDAALTVNGEVTTSNPFVLESGSSLIAKNTTSFGLTYKRNLTTTNWYLVSSPVSGESVVDFVTNNSLALGSGSGLDQNVALASYDNTQPFANDRWSYYTVGQTDGLDGNDVADIFNPIKGFAVKLTTPGDISFSGFMFVTNLSRSISVGAGNAFNLVGNPYPSYVAVNNSASGNNVLKENDTTNDYLTEATLWLWDQSANGGDGGYVAVNHASPARFLAPGQSFFVSANGTHNFLVLEGMQSHQETDSFLRATNTRPEIQLQITNGVSISATDVYYIQGTTTGFDNGYDSTVFGGVTHEFAVYTHLVTDSQGEDFSIQSLPNSNYETMVVPVGVNASSGEELTFSANVKDFPSNLYVYLEDKEENVFVRLDENNANYTVTLNEELNGIGRFYIHTTSNVLNTDDLTLENISVYPIENGALRVVGIQQGKATLKLYNLLGSTVLEENFTANGLNDIPLPVSLKSGIYIVHLETEQGGLNKKIIID